LIDKFRFWISFKLLDLGVQACPDDYSREWLKYGLTVAGVGIERGLTEDESV